MDRRILVLLLKSCLTLLALVVLSACGRNNLVARHHGYGQDQL
jgi:hypothetical protein